MISGFEYELLYSDRRTVCAEIKRGGRLIVRAPRRMSREEVEKFLCEKAKWIEKHLEQSREMSARYDPEKYTKEDIKRLKVEARARIEPLVEYYKGIIGVEPLSVKINSARTRYGSCSGKNNLNFSCFLVLYPVRCIEYVVVHELCHILEHNHSRRFYARIARVMPDYKDRVSELKKAKTEG